MQSLGFAILSPFLFIGMIYFTDQYVLLKTESKAYGVTQDIVDRAAHRMTWDDLSVQEAVKSVTSLGLDPEEWTLGVTSEPTQEVVRFALTGKVINNTSLMAPGAWDSQEVMTAKAVTIMRY